MKKRDPKVVQRFLKLRGLANVPPGMEVDHIIPLADGGTDTVGNLQLLRKKVHAGKTRAEALRRAIRRR